MTKEQLKNILEVLTVVYERKYLNEMLDRLI